MMAQHEHQYQLTPTTAGHFLSAELFTLPQHSDCRTTLDLRDIRLTRSFRRQHAAVECVQPCAEPGMPLDYFEALRPQR